MSKSTYVVGDVHGHRDELVEALRAEGLVDDEDNWSGG
ncbi:MAG TPA: serine/threonine protein phosphatase, partial [Amycolatopsis sp.]